MFFTKKLVAIILTLCCFTTGSLYAAEAPKAVPLNLKGVRILALAGYSVGLTGMPVLHKLTDAGAEVRFYERSKLTWEEAQKYHVIIVLFDQFGKTAAALKSSDEALQKFAQAGGGVFFFLTNFELKEPINQCLAPFGASQLTEYIQDPQHIFTSPSGSFNLTYAYTTNITTSHPLTEGVKGLWYDVDTQAECQFTTLAIDISKDWTTLVSGEVSATSFGIKGQLVQGVGFTKEQMTQGKYQSAPPIIAAREYGAGAIVLAGMNPVEMFYGQGLSYYGDVAMTKGDGLRSSDFGRLYENALGWLAQYGKKSDVLGKGELKPVVDENAEAGKRRFNWTDPSILAGQQCTKPIKGVIGLHSTLSDGKDSPEVLIAKARASGLQWIAFTEKLEVLAEGKWEKKTITQTEAMSSAGERSETLSPAKWEQLRQICKAASTEDFAVLPGLDFADETGSRSVVFGDFEWPEEKFFSRDKTKIVNPMWIFGAGYPPNGPYNVGHNPLHPWDYQQDYVWPIRTTIAGKQTDEAFASYQLNQGIMDDQFPMAVDMVYSEKELGEAAGRMCNYLTMDKPRNLVKFFRENNYYRSYLGFASDGPVVTDWRSENAVRNSGGKWYAATTEQYRLKLSVESTVPISDIKLFDGPMLLQRVCPNQNKVTLTFDIPHDKQRNIFAVITDANGKQAVTGGHFVRDFLNFRFMCSDRGNSICAGFPTDKDGVYLTSPTGPYQRKQEIFSVFPGYGMRFFKAIPPGVDGGQRPIYMQIEPYELFHQFAMDPQQPKMSPIMESRMEVPVCSRDGLLQEHTGTGVFDRSKANGAIGWNCRQVPTELKDIDINVRNLNITARDGDPGVILLEGRINFKKDVKLKGSFEIYVSSTISKPGNGDHYALVTPEQTAVGLNQATPFYGEAPMVPGSYTMIFPAQMGSTGAMALDEGYTARVTTAYPSNRVSVLFNPPTNIKAGDELKYRLILMHGRPTEAANIVEWENFAKKMGLRGKPAYEIVDIKAGKVKGTKFLLELEPEDNGFAGTISRCDLPIRLPVRMANMNQNWTFAYFDLDRKEWFPSAVDQVINQGFFTLDTRRGNHRIFAGHPVVADNKELRILTLSDGKSKVQASVNNVSDASVNAVVRLNPALGKAELVKVRLEPGEVKNVEFSF